ncbi:Hypothetical protein NTJ_01264 [Nesidiocoris tenuis]|uniref:Uncharacterized protein n=1 Tax=Nesidiocoris tenuis TaxID=355587 RepID=A0ABN7A906_9HEMI|nr:Hypothetical protein NTJ_01264 [Nesidiocoris tenuis]
MTSWTVNEEIEITYAVQARPALWNVASLRMEIEVDEHEGCMKQAESITSCPAMNLESQATSSLQRNCEIA